MKSLVGGIGSALRNATPVPYTSGTSSIANLLGGLTGRADPKAAMRAMGSVGTLYAIVHRTSNATAQVKWKLYRKAASGLDEDRTEVTSHAALDLWNKPNPFMPRQEFIETFQQHCELAGEYWWVIGRVGNSVPLELWPVRPDRMTPVPHPTKYLSGYVYTAPDGEKVPLDLNQVIMGRIPDPMDPFRGMGPVGAILVDLEGYQFAAEWNRNFFRNSAEPGGIIEVEESLGDEDFKRMKSRWNEQHRGVSNAHRVAILEQGKWVDRKYSMRDMEFSKLREVSRETIREAFGFPKPMLGAVDDVNRANAEAGEVVFARWLLVERLERIKGSANNELLPMYGATAKGLEFDYENPVPEDVAAETAEFTAKIDAWVSLVGAGVDPAVAADVCELPADLADGFQKPAPVVVSPGPGQQPPDPNNPQPPDPTAPPEPPAARGRRWLDAMIDRVLVPLPTVTAATTPPEVDLTAVQADWETSLDQLIADWPDVAAAQRQELATQVEDAVSAGDLAALAALAAASTAGAALLLAAMVSLAATAGGQVVAEAAAQGVTITAATVTAATLEPVADATAALLASGLAQSAGREALRLYTPDAVGVDVAQAVTTHLESLSDATLRAELGGALTRAQNSARLATLSIAPLADYFGSEVLDKNTCGPCRKIDGHRFDNLIEAYGAYAGGPYWACEGGSRCRGTVVASWNEQVA